MKLIDKKGKFLGIINYLDMLIVILLITAVTGFFYKSKLTADMLANTGDETEIHVNFYFSNVREVTTASLNIGDIIRSVGEEDTELGVIVDKEVTNAKLLTTDSNGEAIYATVPDRYDMIITIEGIGSVSEGDIMLSDKIIKIGQPMSMENRIIRTTGMVYGIDF